MGGTGRVSEYPCVCVPSQNLIQSRLPPWYSREGRKCLVERMTDEKTYRNYEKEIRPTERLIPAIGEESRQSIEEGAGNITSI